MVPVMLFREATLPPPTIVLALEVSVELEIGLAVASSVATW